MYKWIFFPLLCLTSFLTYLALPPTFSVQVLIKPAKYLHISEDLSTKSRVSRYIYLPSPDESKNELAIFYRECSRLEDSGVRVIFISSQNTMFYKLLVQDSTSKISMDWLDCAIDKIKARHQYLHNLLISKRQVIPREGIEDNMVSLIEVKDLSDQSRLKAIYRAVALGLFLNIILYTFLIAYTRFVKRNSP